MFIFILPLPELNIEVREALKLPQRKMVQLQLDRKSTRLNSSHDQISYAVFCLKKKKTNKDDTIEVDGPLVTQPDVNMTVAMMRHFGDRINTAAGRFGPPELQKNQPRQYAREVD